ncbi:MAG: flagellar basal body P-ring protein FlgI, partial [Alphaproteobacteria bacterium]|nr:flagellar basal body P-ring protein FlgI [Alphaproteobacteria bacterium]
MLMCCVFMAEVAASSRIKDIADFEGVRENQLVGYGLIVGLNGTGDNIKSIDFTKESLISMLDQIGINARGGQIKSKNVAAVMVTANLPAFARQGSKIDVFVSAVGDAKNLQGGTLLATPLTGADGNVYALAQGAVAVNALAAQGGGTSVVRGVPTAGKIANGAIIEREIPFALDSLDTIKIALRNPDFTTSRRVADAINAHMGT